MNSHSTKERSLLLNVNRRNIHYAWLIATGFVVVSVAAIALHTTITVANKIPFVNLNGLKKIL